MEVVKVLLNSALSDDAELMTLDIKDYYLGTPLERPEHLRMDVKFITQECMDKYDLHKYVHNGYILHAVNKGMCGLKQAGILAQKKLISHLEPAGYIQSPNVPCLFIHAERGTAISLIVDDFAVKYRTKADADHLSSFTLSKSTSQQRNTSVSQLKDTAWPRPSLSACLATSINFSSASNTD
jgi:hypothetical protein